MPSDDSEVEEVEVPEGEEDQGPVVPTHEPFSFKILSMVQQTQSLNGLRHNDHLRYRQYCSRRLRRLYNALRFKHGRGRFKHNPFPADFNDPRFMEIPLASAERAWSYGVQLKADNAAGATFNAQFRHHSIQRFAKAVKHAQHLESVCKVHGDARTQLEAEAYCALLEGTLLLEKEEWKEALSKLTRGRRVCEHLGLASEQAESVLFKAKVQELAPMIRECRYNLGLGYDGNDDNDDDAPASPKTEGAKSKELSELSYRGRPLAMPSEKIKGKLMKCIGLVGDLEVDDSEENAVIIEKYGALSVEMQDALKDIHADMIAEGADGQTSEWRMLEAFGRGLLIVIQVERNMRLLSKHITKLDGLQEVSSTDARKNYRPDEGMRYCDMLKEDISGLHELPETTDSIRSTVTAYERIIKDCRAFFLGMCHLSVGKSPEAAALMDMLHARIDETELGNAQQDHLGRLHPLFSCVHEGMASRVSRWRCRVLAQLCTEAGKTSEKQKEASGIGATTAAPSDFAALSAFPPHFRDIPCKPLLFDLAFQSLEAPGLDHLLSKRALAGGDDKKASIIGRVAGGLGSRLSGMWGGKK